MQKNNSPSENSPKKKILSKITNRLSAIGKKALGENEDSATHENTDEKTVLFKNAKLAYTLSGQGIPAVLIHGFLENRNTWGKFAEALAKTFLVINIDLPGHGKSELMTESAPPKYMAEAILQVLHAENIKQAFLIGHSMGGYAACAFAHQFPERLSALCLFHSVPFADTEDKKNARNNTIQKINEGGKEEVCKTHVPKVFADDHLKKFAEEIKRGTETALSTKAETIKASLRGMRDRDNYTQTIKEMRQPFLYIEGSKDNFIKKDALQPKQLPDNYEILSLEKSGHMGFIEEAQKALQAITAFGQKNLSGLD